MIQHELAGAVEAVEALEAVFDAVLPQLPAESRREAMAAIRSALTASQVRIRMRRIGYGDWDEEWATRARRIVVGSDQACDITIGGGRLSGAHFELERFGARVAIRDLDSTLGTFIGTERLQPFLPTRVSPRTVIVAARELEFTVLPPPREVHSYGDQPVVRIPADQRELLLAMQELRSAGLPVSPKTISERMPSDRGFSERTINRKVYALREVLGISPLEQRERGYASMLRVAMRLGLLE